MNTLPSQSHTAAKWWSQDLNTDCLALELVLITVLHYTVSQSRRGTSLGKGFMKKRAQLLPGWPGSQQSLRWERSGAQWPKRYYVSMVTAPFGR